MIAPRSLLMKLGGFSEDFFLYGEDQDLCLRMRRAGHEIGFIEDAPVIHEGGLSERGSRDYDRWKRKIEAEYIFYRKHYRPSTVRRISRAYAVKARWRLATLRLALPFLNSPGKEKAREKLAKYRAIDDTVRSQERKENAN